MAYNHQQHEQQRPSHPFPRSRGRFPTGTASLKARRGPSVAHDVFFTLHPPLTTTQRREAPEPAVNHQRLIVTSRQQTATARHPELPGISPARSPAPTRSPQVRESCKSLSEEGKTLKNTRNLHIAQQLGKKIKIPSTRKR